MSEGIHHQTKKGADLAIARKEISQESHAAVHAGTLTLAEARELGREGRPDVLDGGEEHGYESAPKPGSRLSKDDTTQECWCSCGERTNPGRRFKPGHDARAKGIIKRAVRAGEIESLTENQRAYADERNLIEETEQQMEAEEQRKAEKAQARSEKQREREGEAEQSKQQSDS